MMLRQFRIGLSVVLVLGVFLLSSGSGRAQQANRWLGDYRISSQSVTETPYIPPFAYQPFNGYSPSNYYLAPSPNLPTYMTSLNYPRTYGSFEYPRPFGMFQPGLQPTPYSVSPTIYSVYGAPPSANGPGENILSSAMTPIQTTAFVSVWVPADADLRFEGVRTDQKGSFRRFTTPPLVPGREYTYDINATWNENGRSVTRTRHVAVRAGERLYVDFRAPETAEEGTRALRTKPLP